MSNGERYSARWMRILLSVNFAVYAIFGALFLVSPQTWIVSLIFLLLAAAAFRLIASASVVLDDEGVVAVPVLRRHRLPWARVVDAAVGRGSSAVGLAYRVPQFTLDDGTVVVAQNVRSRRGTECRRQRDRGSAPPFAVALDGDRLVSRATELWRHSDEGRNARHNCRSRAHR